MGSFGELEPAGSEHKVALDMHTIAIDMDIGGCPHHRSSTDVTRAELLSSSTSSRSTLTFFLNFPPLPLFCTPHSLTQESIPTRTPTALETLLTEFQHRLSTCRSSDR